MIGYSQKVIKCEVTSDPFEDYETKKVRMTRVDLNERDCQVCSSGAVILEIIKEGDSYFLKVVVLTQGILNPQGTKSGEVFLLDDKKNKLNYKFNEAVFSKIHSRVKIDSYSSEKIPINKSQLLNFDIDFIKVVLGETEDIFQLKDVDYSCIWE